MPAYRPGLYLHLPFCSAICPYCDFAVLVGGERRRERFVNTLIDELRLCREGDLPVVDEVDTIYFGGGTPSLLEPEQLGRILRAVEEELAPAAEPWIHLEANPEDVTAERLGVWAELGVRTLSLGVQSFDAAELGFLGRAHAPEEARRSVELALAAGFATVSVDLIFGLPGQSPASWRRQLETAVELGAPAHLLLPAHSASGDGVRSAKGERRASWP